MSNKENIQKLFSSFGKPSSGRQFNTYLDWADKQDCDEVEYIVEIAIRSFEKFPSLARLYTIANKHKRHDFQQEEECFYCGNTGFVPALFKPIKNKTTLPYTREFSCKCSRGLILNRPSKEPLGPKQPRRYFNEFDRLQFEDQISKYPNLSYPQLVDKVKMEIIKEYHNPNLKPAMNDA